MRISQRRPFRYGRQKGRRPAGESYRGGCGLYLAFAFLLLKKEEGWESTLYRSKNRDHTSETYQKEQCVIQGGFGGGPFYPPNYNMKS